MSNDAADTARGSAAPREAGSTAGPTPASTAGPSTAGPSTAGPSTETADEGTADSAAGGQPPASRFPAWEPGLEDDRPGDPACLLRRVCPACGSVADADPPTTCPQCHTYMPAD